MPITFTVSPVTPGVVSPSGLGNNPMALLSQSCNPPPKDMGAVLQCSITPAEGRRISPQSNGFVQAVFQAYAAHYHLVIRPDDVWIAILTQLSFYVNAHAEELREYFVAHEGQRRLLVEDVGTRHTVDFGRLARAMTREIHKNVVDSTLVEWILPDFTTTTLKDTTICSVLMMSTLKAYFEYFMGITCGIPSVTLEGTKADWQRVLKRLDRLHELGDEPSAWAHMLRPILRRFVAAFDGQPDVPFWTHVVHRMEEYCGQDDMSGWLTAFCVWTNAGKWRGPPVARVLEIGRAPAGPIEAEPAKERRNLPERLPGEVKPESARKESLSTPAKATLRRRLTKLVAAPFKARVHAAHDEFTEAQETGSEAAIAVDVAPSRSILEIGKYTANYTLDDVPYFSIDVGSIPPGYCEVDVTVVDNEIPFPCMMVAGHVATVASAKETGGPLNTIAPAPQWFMIEKKAQ